MTVAWPLPVVSDPRVAAGTLAWYTPDGAFVTVLAKLTLELAEPSQWRLSAPQALATRDTTEGDDPRKSVKQPADTAPYARFAEVVLRGSAWHIDGAREPTRAVKLA